MIGIRATSGSVAIRFRNVVIARSPSSRSASMLTSSRFAPPRTCSSATSTACCQSPLSTSPRKRAEPVTFVRSPTMTNAVSSVTVNGSSPLNRERWIASGQHPRRDALHLVCNLSNMLWCRAAAAADGVDEAVTSEAREQVARLLCRLVVATERVRQARVRVTDHGYRCDPRQLSEEGAHLGGAERAVHPDRDRVRRARPRPRMPPPSAPRVCGRSGRRS